MLENLRLRLSLILREFLERSTERITQISRDTKLADKRSVRSVLEEIEKEFEIAERAGGRGSQFLNLRLSKEAATYLKEFAKKDLEDIRFKEKFTDVLETKPYEPKTS